MGKAYESIKAGLTETIADAVSKRYPVQLQWSAENKDWIVTFPDLPGCSAWGATEAEALAESHDAVAAWLKACKAAGNPIPAPSQPADEADYSGRFVMRIPKRRPTHPGSILREDVLPSIGLTQTECAHRLGVSRLTVSDLLHEKRGVSPDMALRLGRMGTLNPLNSTVSD